jgi:hypothetical protein
LLLPTKKSTGYGGHSWTGLVCAPSVRPSVRRGPFFAMAGFCFLLFLRISFVNKTNRKNRPIIYMARRTLLHPP